MRFKVIGGFVLDDAQVRLCLYEARVIDNERCLFDFGRSGNELERRDG